MSFLGKGLKENLMQLVDELEIERRGNEKRAELKKLIVESEDYDEDYVRVLYENILLTAQAEQEKKEKAEARLEQISRDEALQKAKILQEKELKTKELELNFQLEKLRIEKGVPPAQENATDIHSHSTEKNLKKLIPEFNPERTDISLYLILFERQAKRIKIPKENWVSHLIGLLPVDIISIIARQPETESEDYDNIKSILLKKFKLNPESFRQKFVNHQKLPAVNWEDFAYEIRNYLNEWLIGLSVNTFEELKDLLVADQIKRRVKSEIREHFIDKWPLLKTEAEIVELLDGYECVRASTSLPRIGQKAKDMRDDKAERTHFFFQDRPRENRPRFPPPSNENSLRRPGNRERAFERRANLKCFVCNSESHLRSSCPKLQKKPQSGSVNKLQEPQKTGLLDSYTFPGIVNKQKVEILRDTGATLDVVCRKFIDPQDFCGETIWVQQALSLELICLPLARVEIEGDFGKIYTKAAVCGNQLNQNRYILGNKTAAMIREETGYEFLPTEQVNAVQTRAITKRLKEETGDREAPDAGNPDDKLANQEESGLRDSTEGDEPITIPALEADAPDLELLKIDKEGFLKAQHECVDLKGLFERMGETGDKKNYSVINGLLVRNREDRFGNVTRLLVIPKELRPKIKALCHEGISAHLGGTKSKDKLIRYFYWPNCYKEMDEFVRSCDVCQRAGRANEKKKAPLKLVPVIQEVFSKINIDACGPLPLTTDGHRYILTAVCMASRYPEAVPLVDLTSIRVTEALLNIFSRIGFPRHIQNDQGKSFTSVLTTEFLNRFGIKISRSSVYHPQSNPVERYNRTLKRLLRALCIESGTDWDKHLPVILLALRNVIHESTGYSPAELVYGKNLRTPETLIMERWLDPPPENDIVTEYVFKLINRLKHCHEVAVTHMEEMQGKRKLWYDKNAVKREFKEGDLVLVLAVARPNKLSVQWIGPGKIKSRISETNYVVELPEKKNLKFIM